MQDREGVIGSTQLSGILLIFMRKICMRAGGVRFGQVSLEGTGAPSWRIKAAFARIQHLITRVNQSAGVVTFTCPASPAPFPATSRWVPANGCRVPLRRWRMRGIDWAWRRCRGRDPLCLCAVALRGGSTVKPHSSREGLPRAACRDVRPRRTGVGILANRIETG